MKKLWILLLCLCALPLTAGVSVLSVTDEDKHSRKEDFYHTYEYFLRASKGSTGAKCQATRISSNWFVTAAHCVRDACRRGCSMRVDLMEGPVSAWAQGIHTTQNPTVFIHPRYNTKGKRVQIQYDLALIHLDVNRAPKIYYRRGEKAADPNLVIPAKTFFEYLDTHRSAKNKYQHALHPSLPPIAIFDNMNQVLDRKISVISIFDGVRHVKPDPHEVYYMKDLKYAYTQDFGIRKGMSGSGVMTNTGELIGIISATVGTNTYKGQGKVKHEDLFMFPVFNSDLIDFMKETMGKDFDKIDQRDAYPYLTSKTQKDFTSLVRMMQSPDFNWH